MQTRVRPCPTGRKSGCLDSFCPLKRAKPVVWGKTHLRKGPNQWFGAKPTSEKGQTNGLKQNRPPIWAKPGGLKQNRPLKRVKPGGLKQNRPAERVKPGGLGQNRPLKRVKPGGWMKGAPRLGEDAPLHPRNRGLPLLMFPRDRPRMVCDACGSERQVGRGVRR